MKPETSRKTTPEGEAKRYMVEYRSEDKTHNLYYYMHFDDAQRKYMHLLLDQVTEKDLFRIVRFRVLNDYHGQYITIMESHVYHPAGLYDTEADHFYESGEAPVAPRFSW